MNKIKENVMQHWQCRCKRKWIGVQIRTDWCTESAPYLQRNFVQRHTCNISSMIQRTRHASEGKGPGALALTQHLRHVECRHA
jgi:hypothetical protein